MHSACREELAVQDLDYKQPATNVCPLTALGDAHGY